MSYFPICLDITARPCLVIGGGPVAERKALSLLAHGGRVTVISPRLTPGLTDLAGAGRIAWLNRGYAGGDLAGAFLVIAATDDAEVQEAVHAEAAAHGILLNVADVPKWCNFILPATARRGDLAISVSTGGKSPALARRLREQLEERYGREYEMLLELLGSLRLAVLGHGRPQADNKALFQAIVESDIAQWIENQEWGKVESLLTRLAGGEAAGRAMAEMRKKLAEET